MVHKPIAYLQSAWHTEITDHCKGAFVVRHGPRQLDGGHAFDVTGSYTRPCLDAVGSGVVNAIMVGALLRRVSRTCALPVAQPAG